MPRENYTDDELSGLTDEEKADIKDETLVDEGADEADPPASDVKPADPPPAAPEAKEAAPVAAVKTPEPAPPPPVEAKPAPSPPASLPDWKAPADAGAQIKAIKAQKDALSDKFDEGEITGKEFREQLEALDDKKNAIEWEVRKAELSADATMDTWRSRTVPGFLAEHPEYAKGTPLHASLDAEVRRLQTEFGRQFDPAHLPAAHARIQAGLKGTPKPEDRPEIPPSLARVPASDPANAADGSKYAWLDRLADNDPVAYEAEIDKMTEAEFTAYANAAAA